MIFYQTTTPDGAPAGIIQFGIGLLGASIKHCLLTNAYPIVMTYEQIPFSWHSGAERFLNSFLNTYAYRLSQLSRVTFLWSAGEAAFDTTIEIADEEFALFRTILRLIESSCSRFTFPTSFLLLSSAGGLFEGQLNIGPNDPPRPLRPYGHLKLQQEELLKQCKFLDSVAIVRLSSVYSSEIVNKRKGLFQVLLENGLRNKVTHIYGRDTTLRDFVAARDIAEWITAQLLQGQSLPLTSFLVSSKPSTLYEVRTFIERTLRRKLYISYTHVGTNAEDISFSVSARAKNFQAGCYVENIKKMYHCLNK